MKKILIIVIVITVSTSVYSQLSFGPRFGLSSSKVQIDRVIDYNGDQISYATDKARLGVHAGLFARISIANFYIQPEALFTSSGGRIAVSSNNAGEEIQKLNYNKLDVPVLVGIKLGNFFRINAGPKFSLLLSDDVRDTKLFPEIEQNYKKSTIGYQAGVGFDIWKLYLDFKYEGNLSKFGESITIGNEQFNTDFSNELLMVVLGFNIF